MKKSEALKFNKPIRRHKNEYEVMIQGKWARHNARPMCRQNYLISTCGMYEINRKIEGHYWSSDFLYAGQEIMGYEVIQRNTVFGSAFIVPEAIKLNKHQCLLLKDDVDIVKFDDLMELKVRYTRYTSRGRDTLQTDAQNSTKLREIYEAYVGFIKGERRIAKIDPDGGDGAANLRQTGTGVTPIFGGWCVFKPKHGCTKFMYREEAIRFFNQLKDL